MGEWVCLHGAAAGTREGSGRIYPRRALRTRSPLLDVRCGVGWIVGTLAEVSQLLKARPFVSYIQYCGTKRIPSFFGSVTQWANVKFDQWLPEVFVVEALMVCVLQNRIQSQFQT